MKPAKQEVVTTQQVVPVVESDAILALISRGATDPNFDIDKMERLIAMRDRMMAVEKETAFNDAMAKAQSEMKRVATDLPNKQTQSRYASYAALDRMARPIYTAHGFGLSFNTEPGAAENFIRIVCHVTGHGHTRKYQVDMPADGKGAKGGDVMTKTHAVGSAMTYGQRYLLKMIFNIAIGEDDDGNVGDMGELLTDDQAEKIKAEIASVGANIQLFYKFISNSFGYPIEKVEDIRAKNFDATMKVLDQKRKAKT